MKFAANESRSGDRAQDPLDAKAESPVGLARDQYLSSPASDAAGAHAPPAPSRPKVVARLEPFGLETANAGDHKLIHALLRAVYQAPSYEEP